MPRGKRYRKRSAKQANQSAIQERNDRKKEIDVLVIKENGQKRVHTLRVPFSCKEMDVISLVFSETEVLKDTLGDRILELSKVRVTAAHSCMSDGKSYVLEVKSPMVRVEIHSRASNDSSNQYIIQIQSSSAAAAGFLNFDKFGDLLYSDRFSDVTLCIEGKDICAHKLILANKSPVFQAMLDNKKRKVKIIDSSYNTFLDLLHFVYKGYIVDSVSDNVFGKYSNLIKADDVYCVEKLKELCESKLSWILSTNNVLMCLVLADSHNALTLKQRALDFIVENAKLILEMPSYQSFAQMNPELVILILKNVVLKT